MSAQEQEQPSRDDDVVEAMLADFARAERSVLSESVATDGSGLQHRRREPFVQIPKRLVWSTHLSKGAKSVLFAMLALPPGADVSARRLTRLQREGRDAILASLAELRQFGLYRLERQHKPDGTIRMVNRVSEEPVREWIEDGRTYGDQPVPMRLHADGRLTKYEADETKRRDFRPQVTRAQPKRRPPVSSTPAKAPSPDYPTPVEPTPVDPPPTTETPQVRTTTHLGDQLTTRARDFEPVDNSEERERPRALVRPSAAIPEGDPDDVQEWLEDLRAKRLVPLVSSPPVEAPADLPRKPRRPGPKPSRGAGGAAGA